MIAMQSILYRGAGVQRIRTGRESGVRRTQSRSSWVNWSSRSTVSRSGRVRGTGGLHKGPVSIHDHPSPRRLGTCGTSASTPPDRPRWLLRGDWPRGRPSIDRDRRRLLSDPVGIEDVEAGRTADHAEAAEACPSRPGSRRPERPPTRSAQTSPGRGRISSGGPSVASYGANRPIQRRDADLVEPGVGFELGRDASDALHERARRLHS